MSKRLQAASLHLSKNDEVLARLIERIGPCRLRRERNGFPTLVRAITGQQLSSKAAATISQRMNQLIGVEQYGSRHVVGLSVDQLRAVGLSTRKATYVIALAEGLESGDISLDAFGGLTDEEVEDQLIEIKGVGRWTAQMFMIFSLGRLDVLPCDDAGVRRALQTFYGLESAPDAEQMTAMANPWRPFASVASWYLWKGIDLKIDI